MSDKDEQRTQEEKLPEGSEKASERDEDETPDVEGHFRNKSPVRERPKKRF